MPSASEVINALTSEKAVDWVEVGKALDALEKLSSVSPDGESWQAVLRDRLSNIGHEISVGHLNKIRRAYNFLKDAIKRLDLADDQMLGAPISALEVAEKLSNLDREMGLKAAADILSRSNPVTYLEVKDRYAKYLAEQPEKMTPRQAAWRKRKTAEPQPTATHQEPIEPDATDRLTDNISSLIKDHILSELNESRLEIRRLQHLLSLRDQTIERLKENEP